MSIQYRVPYADTDRMGVVYYANYFVYFERLRNELLREIGLPYTEVEKSGLMYPVIEAHCVYHASAEYDHLITITGWFEWAHGSRARFQYEITHGETLLVEGHTIHAVVTTDGRPRRVPQEILQAALHQKSPQEEN